MPAGPSRCLPHPACLLVLLKLRPLLSPVRRRLPPRLPLPCLGSDAEHGERAGDPRPRYPPYLAGGWVPYIRLDAPQAAYAALNALWAHQPALLRSAPLVAGLVGRWTWAHLVRPAHVV